MLQDDVQFDDEDLLMDEDEEEEEGEDGEEDEEEEEGNLFDMTWVSWFQDIFITSCAVKQNCIYLNIKTQLN